MARYSDDPVRHIITFRINSEEKEILEQLAKKSGRTVSNYMRRKLQLIREYE
jgi:predicted DNA-binding protein